MPSLRGRLAPSPTGHLHLGHARSFWAAWRSARSVGGELVLRLEDLDADRVKPGMVESTLEDLAWLGLDWDGEPVLQSRLASGHEAAVERLVAEGHAYPCVCTRRELAEAASAPHRGEGPAPYPGTCRDRFQDVDDARARTDREPALRFRTPPGAVEFVDAIHGPQSFDVATEVGDFPITRRDGVIAYQLSVVVDDASQGITEVVRGDDLLPSTARQILLQRALDLPSPRWLHLPLVEDHTGRRLAKREGPLSLATLRSAGVDAASIRAWSSRSLGLGDEGDWDPNEIRPEPTQLPPDPISLFL